MLIVAILITAITQIAIALIVFLQAKKNLSYQLFFLISIAALCWALANYLTIYLSQSTELIYIVRFILFFVVLQNAFFYMFARTFPHPSWQHSKKWLGIYGLFTVLAAVATLSPYALTSAEIKGDLPVTVAGPAMGIFALHAAFSIIFAFFALVKKARIAEGALRNQLHILLVASVLIWIIVPITNFVLTPVLETTFFIEFAPIYTLLFSSLVAYAMIKHRLFDIRSAAARATAYMMLLSSLIIIYATFVIGVTSIFFQNNEITLAQNTVYIVAAVFLAFTYNPIKTFFDTITNKLFFRDDYAFDAVLLKLGNATVDETNLNSLSNKSQTVLTDALKPSFMQFLIMPHQEGDANALRRISSGDIPQNLQKMQDAMLINILKKAKREHHLMLREEIKDNAMRDMLGKCDVEIIVHMKRTKQLDGFILLGPKRNGSLYSKKDRQLLATAAHELALAIQNALRFEEIQEFNRTLQEKVDEATAKLRRTNARLRELDDAKDEFVSMASHQLRTPLTSVKGYLSMVLEGDAGKLNHEQKKFLEEAYNGAQRMVFLIGDFLNVSRIKTGKFMLEFAEANLAHMIEDEVTQLRITAETRNLNFLYQAPEEFPTVRLDENKIRQVAMNLIDNAIFYTKPGGTIKVEVYVESGDIVFRVRDDGIGVPLKEQKNLFEKFYRAENARKERPDGTGLGLFMIKKVVLAHGGSIIFESKEGKGSTFGFRLPIKPVNVKPQENPLKIAR